jgi:hypothetical protein
LNSSRRRLALGAAGLALAATAAGCVPSVSSGPEPQDEIVIVCESGVVTKNGVKTSSAVASRVPAGSPIPPGCRLG